MKPAEEQTPQQPVADTTPPAAAADAQSPAPAPQANAEPAATESATLPATAQPDTATTDAPPAPEPDAQAPDSNPDRPAATAAPTPTIIAPDHPIEHDDEDEPREELYIHRKPSQEQLMSVWLSVASLATFAIGLAIDYAPLVSMLLAVMAVYSAIGNKFIAGIVLSMGALALSGGFFALTTIIK